jgi:hypothetical protein
MPDSRGGCLPRSAASRACHPAQAHERSPRHPRGSLIARAAVPRPLVEQGLDSLVPAICECGESQTAPSLREIPCRPCSVTRQLEGGKRAKGEEVFRWRGVRRSVLAWILGANCCGICGLIESWVARKAPTVENLPLL